MARAKKQEVPQDQETPEAAATPAAKKAEKPKKEKTKNEKIREALKKGFKDYNILATVEEYEKGAMPTGSRVLDLAIGDVRGLPKGRVAEIYGLEQTGKTTLALHLIAECQRGGGDAVLVDLEKFDPVYAQRIGVDVEKLIIAKPNESSMILDCVINAVKNGADLVVIDSVAAMAPKKEKEQSIGDDTVGIVAKQMNKALRNLLDITWEHSAVVLFINQLRSDIGMFSQGYVTTGGLGLRAFGSTRLAMKRAMPIRQKSDTVHDDLLDQDIIITKRKKTDHSSWAHAAEIGHGVKVHVYKNKVSAPKKTVELDVIFGQGYDMEIDAFELALTFGIIKQSGSWYVYSGLEVPDANGKMGAAKSQDRYELIDLILQKQAWDKFQKEVDEAWTSGGIAPAA